MSKHVNEGKAQPPTTNQEELAFGAPSGTWPAPRRRHRTQHAKRCRAHPSGALGVKLGTFPGAA
eukprot:9935604-Alexandrium_andersonii.AAC.1